jgi:hypothetical protein
VRIEVTQAHIDKGERTSAFSCPIALALKDHGVPKPAVTYTYFYKSDESEEQIYLPGKVCNFISAFDKGKPVEPFTFELET